MADEEETGYTWEKEYERTWEAIQEDEHGSLQTSIDGLVDRARRKQMLERPCNVRLGMMRHLFLIIDMSHSMEEQDLRPTRMLSVLKLLEHFVEEYFDQNPISQMGLIITRNKRAEKITELGGNPKRHIAVLRKQKEKSCQGEPSLQNALEVALQTLRHVPKHASREVLVVMGSLTTCDPSDIHTTIESLRQSDVKCSVIGLSAQVKVCQTLCTRTRGSYSVILDETHLKDLMNQAVVPPTASTQVESSLIRMGFPHQCSGAADAGEKPSFCMCHLDSTTDKKNTLSTSGYLCPQCLSRYCELPVECRVCNLTLVSAPHLARSYHHLFPVPPFTETPREAQDSGSCGGCQATFDGATVFQCPNCSGAFCSSCDIFIHDTLHSCPLCSSSREKQTPCLTLNLAH